MTTETFFANFGHLADAPNGVKKLRELILQLAVQGKLVPQDPEDEPASVLLGRIRAERKKLIQKKVISKPKSFPAVTDDEIPFAAPLGWEWLRLVDLVTLEYGKNLPAPKRKQSGGIPVYGSNGVVGMHDTALLNGASIIVGRKGSSGALNICRTPFWPTDVTYFVVPPGDMAFDYCYLLLKSLNLNELGKGIKPGLNRNEAYPLLVPLPPLEEQKRIVTKVDQLMTLCDELEACQKKQQQGRVRLNNAALDKLLTAREPDEFADHWQRISTNFDLLYDHPETIGKLRAAILQLAVQGKLVPQEKPELWREGVLGDVVESSEAGWSPQCENRPCTGKEWGVLKVSAVTWGKFIPGENKTLPRHLEPRPRYAVNEGDFLISRANTSELVARSVVVDRDCPRLLMSDKIIRVRFFKEADPNFFNLVNGAPCSREYYARVAGGTSSSMKNVSRKQILELPVIIPPLIEQQRIVAKVNQLMALCDELETKLTQAQQRSEKLMEATVRQLLVA